MRCEFCIPLTIDVLRGSAAEYAHHTTFFELKACAESKACDICLLLWTSFTQNCHKREIDNCLHGRLSDPEHHRDTRIYLHTFLSDMFPRDTSSSGWDGDAIMVTCGPMRHSGTYTIVSIFAEPNTFAARYLVERNTVLSRDPQLRVSISQRWLSYCQRFHSSCGGREAVEMPTRVIDLGEPPTATDLKLFVTQGCYGRYAALSYSWGDGVRHKVKLKKDTVKPFMEAIPESEMTLAHREAIQIARELGYRYIWIDALCIIQGDKEDWAREAVKIVNVYGNAELTIVAGRSNNSLDGFLSYTSKPSPPPSRIPYSILHTDTPNEAYCYIHLPRSRVTGPVDKRAWCFQESLLSRRMIIYGEEQLSFQCRERKDHEDGSYDNFKRGVGDRYDLSTDDLAERGLTEADVLKRWYELSRMYAVRDLYDPTDVFAALSGVATRFQRALGCRYLAGLWENDMIRGLLWKSRRVLGGPDTKEALKKPVAVYGDLKGKTITRAPSWSWLALIGPIWPAIGRTYNRKLQDPSTFRCRPADPLGRSWSPDNWHPGIVKDFPLCRLKVIGCPREVRCSSIRVSEYPQKPKWDTAPRIVRHGILLEPAQGNSDMAAGVAAQDHIVAMGLFDLAEDNPQTLWVMCVLSDEGLMLQRNPDQSFSRLGVFVVANEAWFEQGENSHVVLI
ncbi:heterokaryon incompatibility protein-domain-containing protein [Xylariaceae sp. FL0662B]|nr:heterokaryon incompatibility protein-domain-containing protein [Xylariaceae sp. FL0662B]